MLASKVIGSELPMFTKVYLLAGCEVKTFTFIILTHLVLIKGLNSLQALSLTLSFGHTGRKISDLFKAKKLCQESQNSFDQQY